MKLKNELSGMEQRFSKYEVVKIEIQGQSKIVCFADTDIFSSYFGWLRFLATIKEFGYKVTAV